MEVMRNGKFVFRFDSVDLIKGIKALPSQPRKNKGLEGLSGMIGMDDGLVSLPDISRLDTSVITDAFPYPQIFAMNGFVIVCSAANIYEVVAGALELKLTVAIGDVWEVISSYRYVYMSNGVVAVERGPNTKEYTLSSLPAFYGACNYNGQIMLGAPKE